MKFFVAIVVLLCAGCAQTIPAEGVEVAQAKCKAANSSLRSVTANWLSLSYVCANGMSGEEYYALHGRRS